MKSLGTIHDPVFTVRSYSRFDRYFLRYIKDERDLPFVFLAIRISLVLIPLSVLLFMPFIAGWLWWSVQPYVFSSAHLCSKAHLV